jgi:hypothetical protein
MTNINYKIVLWQSEGGAPLGTYFCETPAERDELEAIAMMLGLYWKSYQLTH